VICMTVFIGKSKKIIYPVSIIVNILFRELILAMYVGVSEVMYGLTGFCLTSNILYILGAKPILQKQKRETDSPILQSTPNNHQSRKKYKRVRVFTQTRIEHGAKRKQKGKG
jgi:hypothetical protein